MIAMHSDHMPTPEEIEAACLKIQKGWSDADRLSRRRGCVCLTKYDAEGVEETARAEMEHRLAKQREKAAKQRQGASY
jgi:hypothetical protein